MLPLNRINTLYFCVSQGAIVDAEVINEPVEKKFMKI